MKFLENNKQMFELLIQ